MEQNNLALSKLCWLLEKRKKVELAYQRAQYKVAYYRKVKRLLEKPSPTCKPFKWKSDELDISKKIESTRLIALKKHNEMLKVRSKLQGPIRALCKKINAMTVRSDNCIIELIITTKNKSVQVIDESKFSEYAAEYEATLAMEKILS